MRTIRIPDPFPRGEPPRKLEWGSSAWAADSCLVEWSRFEREWLEPPKPPVRQRAPAWAWARQEISPRLALGLIGVVALAIAAFI
jgi:hypothetical protein